MAHSILGPSSSERWINCPGSVNATKDILDTPSRFAAEGTLAHSIAEQCLTGGRTPHEFLGTKHTVEGFEFTVDEAFVEGIDTFVEYVRDLKGDLYSELCVSYEEWVPGGFGTADCVVVSDNVCHVVDLKFGQGVLVEAKGNPQLMLYALGFLHDYSYLYPQNALTHFKIHIVQPRLDHIDTVEFTRIELMSWVRDVLVPAYHETQRADAPFKAGPWCSKGFCKIRHSCTVRAAAHTAELVGELENLDAQIDAVKQITMPSQNMTLSNDQVARLLEARALAIKFWKDLSTHAVRELREGRAVGDWKLVSGKSARVFTVPEDEVVASLALEGFDEAELKTKPELKSVAQIEKVVGKKNDTFQSIVKKIPGAPTLAPGKDKREALKADALKEFENLDDQDSDVE